MGLKDIYIHLVLMVLAFRSLAVTRLLFKPVVLAPRPAPYFHTYSTNRRTTKMSDKEEQTAKLDLDYTPERAEELKENIEAVQKEIDDVWAEVEGQGSVKVSEQARYTCSCTHTIADRPRLLSAPVGRRLQAQAC
jgi:hypothetical protein